MKHHCGEAAAIVVYTVISSDYYR